MSILGRCMIFKKFHAWRNARTCIRCSSWIVKEDSQEQHLTCKPNSCFFSLAINACHFLWLDRFLWLARVSSYGRLKNKKIKKKKKKKECLYVRQRDRKELDCMKSRKRGKKRVLDYMKLEYYKEVLDFINIEYHIIFLITKISGQQCHAGNSLGTRVH